MTHLPTRPFHSLARSLRSTILAASMTIAPFALLAVPAQSAQAACSNCGTVVSTNTYQQPAAHGSGLGIATGAVVGGLLGNQVGGGNGRTLATVAGAVGGGYAGNVIEKRARSTPATRIRVRMSNGALRTFTESGNSRWRAGEHVRVVNGRLLAQG
jgi:outer membrane lipoprotein SlyB